MQNQTKQIIWPIVAIVAGIGILFGVTYLFKNKTADNIIIQDGDIISFVVDRPNFIVKGTNLSSVEIYGISTSDQIDESSHILVSTASKTDNADISEVWKATIPAEPILLNQLYVKAVDVNGKTLDRFYFALSGNTDIFNALWFDTPSEIFTMKIGDEIISGDMHIIIKELTGDNRCPLGVQCIIAGEAKFLLNVSGPGFTQKITLSTADSDGLVIDGRRISIQKVTPEAVPGKTISQNEYVVTLSVEQESKG